MTGLTQIAEALAARLRTIAAFDENVLSVVRRPATYPAAIIVPPAIPTYGAALSGTGAELTIPILVLVAATEAEGQQSLFPFLDWSGPLSIPAVIQAQRTLGLDGIDARVVAAVDPGLVELPDGSTAYGATLNVLVMATGDR